MAMARSSLIPLLSVRRGAEGAGPGGLGRREANHRDHIHSSVAQGVSPSCLRDGRRPLTPSNSWPPPTFSPSGCHSPLAPDLGELHAAGVLLLQAGNDLRSDSAEANKMTAPFFVAHSVRQPNGCLVWSGRKNSWGYGQLGSRRHGTRSAHRASWIEVNGPIPRTLCVCHRCDMPACVEVSHLWLGTVAENNADRAAKGRTAPQHGIFNPGARLTDETVDEIRSAEGSTRQIAARFGISQAHAFNIRKGRCRLVRSDK